MLKTLHIENYALIQQSDISFDGGFVAITGETGAGKSIMLGALALLLGGRADTHALFDSSRKCIVEAQFETSKNTVAELFEQEDVDFSDDGSIIIRREILPSGKSRSFVNDTPVGLAFLKELGSRLIDIHSQHANLLLGNSNFQTSLLDIMADDAKELADYRACYDSYSRLKRELEQLTIEDQQNRKDYDYNKFLFDELETANLNDGEQEELEQEATILANAEGIKEALSQVVAICDGDEDSALSRLNSSKSLLSKLTSLSPDFQGLYDRLDSALIELRDIVSTLDSANEATVFSPERQQVVDDRLSLIYRLEKKHSVDNVEGLLDIEKKLGERLSAIDMSDERIHQVMEAVDKAYKTLQAKGEVLTKCRLRGAKRLEEEITPLLAELGMPNATLKAMVEGNKRDVPVPKVPESLYGPLGCDNVALLFNANKGGELREIAKVASGGEMSRLMLAIKSLTSRAGLLPTIVFDEIDTGISGDISLRVANIMYRMASKDCVSSATAGNTSMQVIAITHLPQIAARASQHYKVYKEDAAERTTSNIRLLTTDERRYELAVMLSSNPPSEAALQTAAELMH